MGDYDRYGRDDRYRQGRGDRDENRGGYGRPAYDEDRGYGARAAGGQGGYATGSARNSYDRDREFRGGDEDRGFFDRAADEVRSWFGDETADQRRHRDLRADPGHTYHYHSNEQTGSGFGNQTSFGARPGGQGDTSRYGSSGAAGGYGAFSQGGGQARQTHVDDHYRSWRDQRMQEFDKDYHEYRQHRQSQFESDFADWRTNRQTQSGAAASGMDWATKVREHMPVLGTDGAEVGKVDKVDGDQIKLTKRDGDGKHHFIPLSAVTSVDSAVRLNCQSDQAVKSWRTEA